jgi:hypothetical protein
MFVAGIIAIVLLCQSKVKLQFSRPLLILIGVYLLLHLVSLVFIHDGFLSVVAGLVIDLRYIAYFGLVFIAASLYPDCRRTFLRVGLVGALIVLIFALLQVFVLPADILKYIGYSKNTISPYLTVDQNNNFIRINSTLRGPNPLGAYASIVLTIVVAWIANHQIKTKLKNWLVLSVLVAGGLVALWFSYSRSALVGGIVAILIVVFVTVTPKLSIKGKLIGIVTAVVAVTAGVLLIVSQPQLASNLLLHDNPNDSNSVNSNEGHISSLKTSLSDFIKEPFGAGVGSTGSASLYGSKPVIIENQYLFVAHEVGWLGIGLFLAILFFVFKLLWGLRHEYLSLGILASGIGLCIIGLVLPVWADDTVAIVWWGLAGLALGANIIKSSKDTRKVISYGN